MDTYIRPPNDVIAARKREHDRKFRLEEIQADILQDILIEEESVYPHGEVGKTVMN